MRRASDHSRQMMSMNDETRRSPSCCSSDARSDGAYVSLLVSRRLSAQRARYAAFVRTDRTRATTKNEVCPCQQTGKHMHCRRDMTIRDETTDHQRHPSRHWHSSTNLLPIRAQRQQAGRRLSLGLARRSRAMVLWQIFCKWNISTQCAKQGLLTLLGRELTREGSKAYD